MANSNWPTPMRSHVGGENAKTNQTWTTINLAVHSVTITTKTSWPKSTESDTLTNSTSKDLLNLINRLPQMLNYTLLKLQQPPTGVNIHSTRPTAHHPPQDHLTATHHPLTHNAIRPYNHRINMVDTHGDDRPIHQACTAGNPLYRTSNEIFRFFFEYFWI